MKVIKKYDPRERRLHVYPVQTIFVGEATVKGPKHADLDEVFGSKKDREKDEQQEDTDNTNTTEDL